ncbi:hypothetical protein MEG05_05190 [Vibrio aestuarianus]|nr:hypothetical protein [Vibrio aestuarianus]MDE1313657.1 hypothetical protein [Vibrio aestuarianus]
MSNTYFQAGVGTEEMVERRLHENKNAEAKELNSARLAKVAIYIAFSGG